MIFNKLLEKVLDLILSHSTSFQGFINHRFQGIDSIYINSYGIYYEINFNMFHIDLVRTEYKYNDITKDDVVLDLGANIGAFAMPVSLMAKKVYAVEPIWDEVLERNIKYNKINNIEVLKVGLGKNDAELLFQRKKKYVNCYSLCEIINMCGEQITFMKIDVEGVKRTQNGEWFIKRNELKGIRRIEMEVHTFEGETIDEYLPILADYDVVVEYRDEVSTLVHATRKAGV